MFLKEKVIRFKSHLFGESFYTLIKIDDVFYLERYIKSSPLNNSYHIDCYFDVNDISTFILLLDGFENLEMQSNIDKFKIYNDYFEFEIQNVISKRMKFPNECIPKLLKILRISEYIIKKNKLNNYSGFKHQLINSVFSFYINKYYKEEQISYIFENKSIADKEFFKVGNEYFPKLYVSAVSRLRSEIKKVIYILNEVMKLFSFKYKPLKEEDINNTLYGVCYDNLQRNIFINPLIRVIINIFDLDCI